MDADEESDNTQVSCTNIVETVLAYEASNAVCYSDDHHLGVQGAVNQVSGGPMDVNRKNHQLCLTGM